MTNILAFTLKTVIVAAKIVPTVIKVLPPVAEAIVTHAPEIAEALLVIL
jgi:hypothetical protein